MKHKIIPIFIPHEGCPHDCSFCNQKKIAGAVSSPDEEEIKETIGRYRSSNSTSHPTYTLAYYGGSFTAIQKERQIRLLQLAEEARRKGFIQRIRISTRPDYLTREHVQLLSKYGVDYVEIGVQSTDPVVLSLAGRHYDVLTIQRGVEELKKANIGHGYQMMVGLPGDSEEKLYATTWQLLKGDPGSIRIYPCLVLADTLLESWYQRGEYRPLEIREAVEWTKIPYAMFTNRKIPIIRMGLHASESLQQADSLIAGPFHPAFGEMVVSSIYKDLLKEFILDKNVEGETIIVGAEKKIHSKIIGNKSFVVKELLEETGVTLRLVQQEDLGDDVLLDRNGERHRLQMKSHLHRMEAFYQRKFNTRK